MPAAQLLAVQEARRPQRVVVAGDSVIEEGQRCQALYTLFSGWAYRYKTLSDGRMQILGFVLPGDFIGLQQRMRDGAPHGVRALTDVWLCPFPADTIERFQSEHAQLAYDVTWICAATHDATDESLLSVGRRTSEERIAALLLTLYQRVRVILGPGASRRVPFPLTQALIAQAMGLSLVHTHRVMRRLHERGLHRIDDGQLEILNPRAIERLADIWDDGTPEQRPLL